MARFLLAGAGMALLAAGAAEAQGPRPGAPYPMPGRQIVPGPGMHHPPMPPAPRTGMPPRWGSKVGGRWWGGVNAPGGWASYRQPYRGYRVPSYWVAPRFYVTDWNQYGLAQPYGGYNWARYYDDAVLIDRSGSVYDYRSGIDWDGEGYDRRSNGVGGAVAGAVVGGVAGNLIAGRGDRLGGTLIGAGVGAAAGYAIDRSRERRGPPPGYREAYRDGDYRDGPGVDGPPPRDVRRVIIRRERADGYDDGYARPGSWTSPDGTTVTTVTSGGPPLVIAPPPYGYAGGVTTITVQSQPVVTTTTTETIEDVVTYTRPAYRHRVWRAKPKGKLLRRRPGCACGS